MSEHFDAAVLGMGPGGEVAAGRLLKAGLRVAVIERELIGGECAYWACIPSKTLLRPPEARTEADRAAGVTGAGLDWAQASDYRDYMIRHLDDHAQITGYERHGATVVKAEAALAGPGRIRAGDREITAEHIIVATGSDPVIPRIEGVEDIAVWTNREAFTATALPEQAVIVGGSAVGTETATFLARFGVHVTLVHRGERLMEREDPRVGQLAQAHLEEAGITVRLNATAARVRKGPTGPLVDLEDGTAVPAQVLMLATRRTPRTQGLGLEDAGPVLGPGGRIRVDSQCRAAEGLWAIGDATGIMPFTHVAKYQGRIAAENILGNHRDARYQGIPRVVFGDPEIAAAGLTKAQADRDGLDAQAVEIDLAHEITRPWTYEKDPRGCLGLLADSDRRVLLGAWAVAPLAGEWIHHASLAIRAAIPLSTLRDMVPQFPTYHEAYQAALDRLGS